MYNHSPANITIVKNFGMMMSSCQSDKLKDETTEDYDAQPCFNCLERRCGEKIHYNRQEEWHDIPEFRTLPFRVYRVIPTVGQYII